MTATAILPLLSIVIPTVRYSESLDKAIISALTNISCSNSVIVVVNNKNFSTFYQSRYYHHPNVEWLCSYTNIMPIWQSFNYAVNSISSKFIFILSDDDIILPGFLDDINLSTFSDKSLYAVRTLIGKDLQHTYSACMPTQDDFDSCNKLDILLQRKSIYNHVSLFVFSKYIFNLVGGFRNPGYPNGYFFDTVFHAHLLANCDYIHSSSDVVFFKTESKRQESAKFYLNFKVNSYIKKVVDCFWDDHLTMNYCKSAYGSKAYHAKQLLYSRFNDEFYKLQKLVYTSNTKQPFDVTWLCLNAILTWNTSIKAKQAIATKFLSYLLKSLMGVKKNTT